MTSVELSSRAAEWLDKAEPDVHEQIIDRLDQAVAFPDHFLHRLTGRPLYKLRAGDYRCIIDWRQDEEVLFVREIGHRRNIYD
ncbi:MAG: type II toxin-antitoxin system RelE/ParE family toxin [Halobacteriales archaeon]|nr:type II toxin-antitoxin system RelE/ParE family toxin [Halobacteriales archaeon]